ncbi:MAG: heme lyase CcmF/NrfE family subunit [Nevskiaceae bacterium]|nr:MAG: heme lyase CcmF/NrfE family subunit [Nevskiaceae bacterium]
MIPELGLFCLILALCIAVLQATIPLVGASYQDSRWMSFARPASWGQLTFITFSFACLAYSLLMDDFSVAYVANNSNSLLPWYYKFSAVWAAHEGSLLLWVLILSFWMSAVSLNANRLPENMLARVLAVMSMISFGFLLLLITTSNPFSRLLINTPTEGQDLNPLLQHIGLIFHPPILYTGYVGFSVAFAFAIAALLEGRLDGAWARWSRPWTLTAWAFLGMGITLGSWWAYAELGWGSWWFWDPVENASFMPWLVGAALIHSLVATEKRGTFKSWTVLLAIAAFSLSLLGTFLVRSGVLTSVHAFASDPARGIFVLTFLLIVIGGSLALFAFRAPTLKSHIQFSILSRETLLLINNLLLVVAAGTILLGTVYPLILDALTGTKLSVGPPYFNLMFVPTMALLMLAVSIGVFTQWKNTPTYKLTRLFKPILIISILVAIVIATLQKKFHFSVVMCVLLTSIVVLAGIRDILDKTRHKGLLKGITGLNSSYWSMQLAHLGFAVCALGAVMATTGSAEREARMMPGSTVELEGYYFKFEGTHQSQGPNYISDQGVVRVLRDDQEVAVLHPEKRIYQSRQTVMTEAGIQAGIIRDYFVALGEPLGGGAWAVRVQIKPFVRWIWFGALLMALGGLLAASSGRYRMKQRFQIIKNRILGTVS